MASTMVSWSGNVWSSTVSGGWGVATAPAHDPATCQHCDEPLGHTNGGFCSKACEIANKVTGRLDTPHGFGYVNYGQSFTVSSTALFSTTALVSLSASTHNSVNIFASDSTGN